MKMCCGLISIKKERKKEGTGRSVTPVSGHRGITMSPSLFKFVDAKDKFTVRNHRITFLLNHMLLNIMCRDYITCWIAASSLQVAVLSCSVVISVSICWLT